MTTSKSRKRRASRPAGVPAHHLQKWLKKSRNATAYIEAMLEEGNAGDLLYALQKISETRGSHQRSA